MSIIAVLLMVINTVFGSVSDSNLTTTQVVDLYCPNDPGDHPSYDEWYDDATYHTHQCPQGTTFNWACMQPHREWYWSQLNAANKAYRLAVCACWDNYPNNVVAREACIAEAKRTFEEFHESLWLTYLAMLDACCITNP